MCQVTTLSCINNLYVKGAADLAYESEFGTNNNIFTVGKTITEKKHMKQTSALLQVYYLVTIELFCRRMKDLLIKML